ncbi:hypothetical protein BN2475_240010 [Paraburkholderia ribeironis]|uniref:Uncharacterized protein n=1 Tax=Paraburkholderia ribeironis TaxID=1247936 RepID=A0A1N7RY58_9BURK|nr:hypothetical protein BN2475_240010 [Paraburkholderia ribeironis]
MNRVVLRDDTYALAGRGNTMVEHGPIPERLQMSSTSGLGHGRELGRRRADFRFTP